MVATEDLAKVFRAEPAIVAQLDRLKDLDMAVNSIGNVTNETHLVAAGMATIADMTHARTNGAKGVIACRYINEDGSECHFSPSARLISAPLEKLRNVKKKLLVVCGEDRLDATHATLRGKCATHLVVDETLAHGLLK